MALESETVETLDADPEVEEAWAAEVERRQTEIENGTVSLLSGPKTLAKLKAEFERNAFTFPDKRFHHPRVRRRP